VTYDEQWLTEIKLNMIKFYSAIGIPTKVSKNMRKDQYAQLLSFKIFAHKLFYGFSHIHRYSDTRLKLLTSQLNIKLHQQFN
jgi:hypothetical protein